jgi:hypothetical protein
VLVGAKQGRSVGRRCPNWEFEDIWAEASEGCRHHRREFDDRQAHHWHAWSRWLLRTVKHNSLRGCRRGIVDGEASDSSFVLLELLYLALFLIVLQGALIRDCRRMVMWIGRPVNGLEKRKAN